MKKSRRARRNEAYGSRTKKAAQNNSNATKIFRASKANEEKFRLGWGDIDEEYLRAAWESFKGPFAYDAYDAADDWWNDWGLLQARMSAFSDPNAGSFLGSSATMVMEGLTRTKVESVY